MTPRKAILHTRNGGPADAVLSRQWALGSMMLTDIAHGIVGQLGIIAALATLKALWMEARTVALAVRGPAFRGHVLRVIGCAPKEEVCRIDAAPIVAGMKHPEAIRDWSVVQFPRNAMASLLAKSAIAAPHDSGLPRPAFTRTALINLWPKKFGYGLADILALSHWAPPVPVVRDRIEPPALSGPVHFSTGRAA